MASRRAERIRVLALAVALAAAAGTGTAGAKERLVRQLGRDLGIPLQHVGAIAQDGAGYLWFGAAAGLYRYDGVDLRRWASVPAAHLATGPDGTLYAAVQEGPVFRVMDEGVEPVPSATEGEWQGTIDIEVDAEGRLWVLSEDGRVSRRSNAGGWEQPLSAGLDGERARRLKRHGDQVLVLTRRSLWTLTPEDRALRLATLPVKTGDALLDVVRMSDGTLFFSTWFGKVLELREGRLALRAKMTGVSRTLVRRGDVVWAVADDGMAAVRPDGTTDYLPLAEHPAQKGITAFVDREGSLWVGHGRGAFQFPEPDTVAWSLGDGLPAANMRLARTQEGVWITFWGGGLGIIRATENGHRAARVPQRAELPACVTRAGTLWGAGTPIGEAEPRIMSRGADGAFRFHGSGIDFECREAPDGSVWITTAGGSITSPPTMSCALSDVPAACRGASSTLRRGSTGRCG